MSDEKENMQALVCYLQLISSMSKSFLIWVKLLAAENYRNDFNILCIIFFSNQTFLKLRLQTQKISNNNKALENKKWDFA